MTRNHSGSSVQNKRGEWVPAIPEPYYGIKKVCRACAERFWRRENYNKHYLYEHIWRGR